MASLQYVGHSLVAVKRLLMAIGALLFIIVGAHAAMAALSPRAAHTYDVQPEIHDSRVAVH